MSEDDLTLEVLRDAASFDDETLEHLANKGLLRRARKLLSEAPTLEAADDALHVVAATWRVRFAWATPVSKATCPCATSGICQHVIAAILALRDSSSEASPAPTSELASVQEQLLSLTDDEVRAWAKVVATRWAIQRQASINPAQIVVVEEGHVRVELPAPYATVRFMSPLLDSAIVKPSTQHDRRAIVLALLGLWSCHGRFMHDDTAITATATATELPKERLLLVRRAQELSSGLIAVGLLHLGDSEREKLDSLSASARGVKLYRLALLAERAADQVDALTTLSTNADTGRLLDQVAEIAVVAETIETHLVGSRPIPDGLCGTARARYEPVGQLRLLGLGHYDWGDHRFAGRTAVFVSDSRQFFTVAQPRIVNGRYLSDSVGWSGAASLDSLTGKHVALSEAKASSEHRLSGSKTTNASPLHELTPDDLAVRSWQGEPHPSPSRLLGRVAPNWVVLGVETQVSPPTFDPVTQRLEWQVIAAGTEVTVSLPYNRSSAVAIRRLEHLTTLGPPDFMIGRLRVAGKAQTLWPISLMLDGEFHNLATPSTTAQESTDLTQNVADATVALRSFEPPSHLEQLKDRLNRIADSGQRPTLANDVAALATKSADWGFTILRQVINGANDPTLSVLRAAWTLQLLADTNEASPTPAE